MNGDGRMVGRHQPLVVFLDFVRHFCLITYTVGNLTLSRLHPFASLPTDPGGQTRSVRCLGDHPGLMRVKRRGQINWQT